MKNIVAYIDFDGTIVDVMNRYFSILMLYLYNNFDKSFVIDFYKYKNLKRMGYKDHEIVKFFYNVNFDIEQYVKFKRQCLESFEYLEKDVLIGSPDKAYDILKKIGYDVVILSQRNNAENLIKQISNIKCKKFYDSVVCVKPLSNGQNSKLKYISKIYNKQDIIIGDSNIDMQVSKVLNISGYFVESGLFNKSNIDSFSRSFKNYNEVADYVYNNFIIKKFNKLK